MSLIAAASSVPPDHVILEGRMKQTKAGEGIDYRSLSSCFALTAKLKDGTLLGAHFGHFGHERKIDGGDGVVPGEKVGAVGMDPATLFQAFRSKVREQARAGNGVTVLNLDGHLDLWNIQMLGVPDPAALPLSRGKAVRKIADMISDSYESVRATDSSNHSSIWLKFASDGVAHVEVKG